MTTYTTCEGCGLKLPQTDGIRHKYIVSSAECWRIYGEVLAREYSDLEYWRMHSVTANTYPCQHPGGDDKRAIQSVSLHLCALYLMLEEDITPEIIPKYLKAIVQTHKKNFVYLNPPSQLGDITVQDVWRARNAKEHEEIVWKWAHSVWDAWKEHHSYVQELVKSSKKVFKD